MVKELEGGRDSENYKAILLTLTLTLTLIGGKDSEDYKALQEEHSDLKMILEEKMVECEVGD